MSKLWHKRPDCVQRIEQRGRICSFGHGPVGRYYSVVHTKLGTVAVTTDTATKETYLDFAARGRVHLRTYSGHIPTSDELSEIALQFATDVVNQYKDGSKAERSH